MRELGNEPRQIKGPFRSCKAGVVGSNPTGGSQKRADDSALFHEPVLRQARRPAPLPTHAHTKWGRCGVENDRYCVQVIIERVAVGVQSFFCGAVAEHPLERFDIGAGRHRKARAGVPQLMRSQARDADALGRVVELAASERAVAQHRAGLRTDEHVRVERLDLHVIS